MSAWKTFIYLTLNLVLEQLPFTKKTFRLNQNKIQTKTYNLLYIITSLLVFGFINSIYKAIQQDNIQSRLFPRSIIHQSLSGLKFKLNRSFRIPTYWSMFQSLYNVDCLLSSFTLCMIPSTPCYPCVPDCHCSCWWGWTADCC